MADLEAIRQKEGRIGIGGECLRTQILDERLVLVQRLLGASLIGDGAEQEAKCPTPCRIVLEPREDFSHVPCGSAQTHRRQELLEAEVVESGLSIGSR